MNSTFKNNKKYSWATKEKNGVTIYFKGHFFYNSVFYEKNQAIDVIFELFKDKTENDFFLNSLNSLDGNFSIYYDSQDVTIAAVDKINSFPLFYKKEKTIVEISNSPYSINSNEEIIDNLNDESVCEFLSSGYTIGKKTLVENIQHIQAGQCLILKKYTGELNCNDYYLFFSENKVSKSKEELYSELDIINHNIFSKLIKSLNGKQVVIPLSGGLDSRILLAYLLKLGYKNIKTYTYGIKGLWEVKVAKEIAKFCNVEWRYIEFDKKKLKKIFHSDERIKYFKHSSGLCTTPNMSGFYAHKILSDMNYIEKDAIIINGQTGDFITGAHIPHTKHDKEKYNLDFLLDSIVNKHFSLWSNNLTLASKENIKNKVLSELKLDTSTNLNHQDIANYFELFEWRHRQSQFIVNGSRMYEWFGHNWRLPLWDSEYLNFWMKIPLKYKLNQNLYKDFLNEKNPYNLFTNFNVKGRNTYTPLVSTLNFLVSGVNKVSNNKFKNLRNLVKYFNQYGPYYPHKNFISFAKTALNHRNAVSYWSKQVIREIDKK